MIKIISSPYSKGDAAGKITGIQILMRQRLEGEGEPPIIPMFLLGSAAGFRVNLNTGASASDQQSTGTRGSEDNSTGSSSSAQLDAGKRSSEDLQSGSRQSEFIRSTSFRRD